MTFPTTSIFSRKCCFRLSFIRIMYNYFLKNSKKNAITVQHKNGDDNTIAYSSKDGCISLSGVIYLCVTTKPK